MPITLPADRSRGVEIHKKKIVETGDILGIIEFRKIALAFPLFPHEQCSPSEGTGPPMEPLIDFEMSLLLLF